MMSVGAVAGGAHPPGSWAQMKPLSRGRPPEEFTLRVPCPLSQQFALSHAADTHNFEIEGVRCVMELVNGTLVISASGFSTIASAAEFFRSLQHKFAQVAVAERIAASFPAQYATPIVAPYSFMPGDMRCAAHGWPALSISPLLVPPHDASIYPEHEYVAIGEVPAAFTPIFTYSLARLADKLGVQGSSPPTTDPVDERILLAASAYVHAARTTQWVWSFLLTVMTLEMLAHERRTSGETRSAIERLIGYAKDQYGTWQDVDLQRITDCLSQGYTISKTRALQELVKGYCAPGVALFPLTEVFTDAADCERKVREIYVVRSKYLHEGRIKTSLKLKYPFEVLSNAAIRSLEHILRILLAS
jgi:hypothetical protein